MKVDFEKLNKAIEKVRATVAKKNQVEAYTWFCIRDGKISSFDGTTGTVAPCQIDDIDCCVPARKFMALAGALSKQEGEVEHQDGWLEVKAGTFKARIPSADVRDFPDLLGILKGAKVYCQASNLVDALKACRDSMEKDKDREAFYGVGFRGPYAYSVDGKRATRATLDSSVPSSLSIAKPAVDQIVRLGDPKHFGPPKYLFLSGNNVGALYPEAGAVLVTRALSSNFPFDHLDEAFNGGPKNLSLEIPDEMEAIVKRVRAMVDDEESQLLLSCCGRRLTISSRATETGTTQETLTFPVGEAFEAKIKAHSLWSVLTRLQPEQIDLSDLLYGQKRSILFRGDCYEHICALMT